MGRAIITARTAGKYIFTNDNFEACANIVENAFKSCLNIPKGSPYTYDGEGIVIVMMGKYSLDWRIKSSLRPSVEVSAGVKSGLSLISEDRNALIIDDLMEPGNYTQSRMTAYVKKVVEGLVLHENALPDDGFELTAGWTGRFRKYTLGELIKPQSRNDRVKFIGCETPLKLKYIEEVERLKLEETCVQ
jgi:hypothetical protein